MSPTSILKFNASAAVAEEYFLPAEKLLSGNPRQTLIEHYTNRTRKSFSGTREVVVPTREIYVIYEA